MYGRTLQRLFLTIPVLYLFSLTGIAFYRSSVRKSVITSQALVASSDEAGENEGEGLMSKLQLQDFHRIEIKDGKPLWEIKAKDAKYFPLEFVTHVNGAELRLFQDKHRTISVKADAAKLYLGGTTISKALLDGHIQISSDENFDVRTEQAEFDASQKLFTAPGSVTVSGEGFEVKGTGLSYPFEAGVLQLEKDVHCTFLPGAQIPKGIGIPAQ